MLIITLLAMNLIGIRMPITVKATENGMTLLTEEDVTNLTKTNKKVRTSVHDPSVVANDDGAYYIFGSHMGVSKTEDLINWESVTNESLTSSLFGNIEGEVVSYEDAFTMNAYTGTVTVTSGGSITVEKEFGTYNAAAWIADNSVGGNMWAPDVI